MNLDLTITRLKKAGKILRSPSLVLAFLRFGVFAGVEHCPVLSAKLKTIVDVGANKGQFALAARKCAPFANIFSFEPLNAPAKIFKALFASDSQVYLNEVAIGANVDRSVLHVSQREDSSSLLPIGPSQIEYYPGTQEKKVIVVNVAPLSSLLNAEDIQSPSMLKIDVQGFELEVLQGCDSLIDKFDYIYCECSFIELYKGQKMAFEIIEWLAKRNFQFAGVYNLCNTKDNLPIQADFYFRKI